WPPVGLAPDEVTVLPCWPSGHAFLELGGTVGLERCHERGRERDRAPALVRFQLSELEPAAGSLRAGPSMPGAVRRAMVTMAMSAAGMRVGAAVPPGQPL